MKNFQIYYPIRPYFINQGFGNPSPVYTNLGLLGHNGIDMRAYHGEPIYAGHDGLAIYEVDSGGGHGVVIKTNEMFNYEGVPTYFKTIYWHMVDSAKEPKYRSPIEDGNKQVKAGDLIGYADNTGISTGDHLHFGCKPMLPGEPDGEWYNYEQNNGYFGSIDPSPYFNGLYAEDIKNPRFQFTRDLTVGSVGTDVIKLQQLINDWGYGSFTPTGFFGVKTQVGVIKLQKAYSITPDVGYFGPKTRLKINNII